MKFSSILNKNAFWRGEASKKGYDVAFLDWLRAHHPDSYKNELTKAQSQVQPSK